MSWNGAAKQNEMQSAHNAFHFTTAGREIQHEWETVREKAKKSNWKKNGNLLNGWYLWWLCRAAFAQCTQYSSSLLYFLFLCCALAVFSMIVELEFLIRKYSLSLSLACLANRWTTKYYVKTQLLQPKQATHKTPMHARKKNSYRKNNKASIRYHRMNGLKRVPEHIGRISNCSTYSYKRHTSTIPFQINIYVYRIVVGDKQA